MVTNNEKMKIISWFNQMHKSIVYLFLMHSEEFWEEIEEFIPELLQVLATPNDKEPKIIPGNFDVAFNIFVKYIKRLNSPIKTPKEQKPREQYSFQF